MQKYSDRAAAASTDYVEGARSTTRSQSAAAIAGAGNWAAGLQAAIAGKRYEAGLRASGDEGWRRGVEEKGAVRYAGGVASGANKYAQNSGKFDSARGAANGLPRGPKGSEQNYQRSKTVGMALRKLKLGA